MSFWGAFFWIPFTVMQYMESKKIFKSIADLAMSLVISIQIIMAVLIVVLMLVYFL